MGETLDGTTNAFALATAFLLGCAFVFAGNLILRKIRKGFPVRFCRWAGKHVPCFDMLALLKDGAVVADASGKIVFLNPAAGEILGINPETAAGKPYGSVLRFTEDNDSAAPVDPLLELKNSKKPYFSGRRLRILSPDGKSWRTADGVLAIPRRDALEPHTVLLFHDATERLNQEKRFREELERSDVLNAKLNELIEEYELLLDIMPVYFYIEDADNGFKHIKCNRICENLWGRPVNEIIGKSDEELFQNEEEIRKFRETDLLTMKNSALREDILPFTGTDGKRRVGRFFRRGVTLADGRRRMFGLVLDITEEADQRARLNAALNAFEYAFDLTRSALFRLDTETRVMFGAKNLGTLWPLKDGKGVLWSEVVHPEDREIFSAERAKLLSGESDKMIVDYRSDYFGELKYYRLEAGLDHITNGRTTIVGIIQDVTEGKRKDAEYHGALRKQNAILNAILSSIPSQVFIKDVRDGFRYKLANRNFTDYYHITEADVVNHSDFEIFPKTVAEQLRGHDTEVCASPGKVFRFDEDISYRQGGKEIFKSLKICFETEDHHPYLLGVCVDVTELETAKRRAEENAERLRLTLNSIGDGVLTTDLSGRISLMNPVAERMTGVRQKDARGLPHEQVFRIVSSIDDGAMPSPITRSIRTGNVVELANHTDLLSASGERYHIADSSAPIFNTDGRIVGAILVFRDVTEEYLQRDLLHTAMTQLELGAEMTLSATFRLDPSTQKISGSKLLPGLWPVRDGRAAPPEDWIHPDDLAAFRNLLTPISGSEHGVQSGVYRTKSSGGLRHYRISMVQDLADFRKPMLFGVIQDITEIRESAARLKAVQELWEQIIHSIPTMFFAKDADNGFRYMLCNQAFAAFVGKTPEEVIGKTDAELFASGTEASAYIEKDARIMTLGKGERFEELSTDSHGIRHFIRSFKRPITGLDNRRLLLGVCVDVTEMHNLLQYEQVNNEVLTCAVTEPDFSPLVMRILETMRINLKCDRVIFARIEQDNLLHCFKDVYSERSQPLEIIGLKRHESLWNRHLPEFRNHEFIRCEDFSETEGGREFLKIFPEYPTRSIGAEPVFLGEELLGVLIVSFVEKHSFETLDRRMMGSMANMIALAQIRERQHIAVKRAELRNQTILDNLNIPVWLYDLNGIVVQKNRAAEEMLQEKEISRKPYSCRELFACGLDEDHCPVRQCVLNGRPGQCEYRSANGRDFISDARPIYDETGAMVNVVKSLFDVTPLRRMIGNQRLVTDCLASLLREKDILRALELSLKSICEHAGADRCYITQFHPETKTISSFMEYSRTGKPSPLGSCRNRPYSVKPEWEGRFRNNPILAIPDIRGSMESEGLTSWKRVIEDFDCRSFYAHEIRFQGKIWGYIGLVYEKNPKVLNPEDLDFFGAVAYCVELTLDRRQNQEEVLAALEKARAADRAKSIFLASMSHEIRTPLNAVIGFAELLKEGRLPEKERKEYLESIFDAGNSLLSLINDVLDLSKLEAGQMALTPAPIVFQDLVREVEKIFHQKCSEKNLFLRSDLPADLPLLWLDKLRIRQILFNLIGNAVKFTDRGGISVKVRFDAEGSGEFGILSIHVMDTGCGIAPEDQKQLFQMFVQASALRGTQAASGGTGLGLAICKRLAEQMNGEITLKSEPGKGSDFSVTLKNVRFSVPEGKGSSPEKPSASAETAHVRPVTLLVDDVPMNLRVMSAMLEKLGVPVLLASNAREAMTLLETKPVNLIMTDLWMPGMNGAELAAKVRKDARFAGIKLIAVTADTGSGENFDMSPFDGLLTKPLTLLKIQDLFDGVFGPPSPKDGNS